MNQTIVSIFTFLERLGLVDVLLPFVLIFVIAYGIFDRTQVLGKNNKNANVIVAMVLGFLVVGVINYVNILNDIVRIFGLLAIMAVCFALIYGLFGKDLQFIKGNKGDSGSSSSNSSKKGQAKPDGADKIGTFDPTKPPFQE